MRFTTWLRYFLKLCFDCVLLITMDLSNQEKFCTSSLRCATPSSKVRCRSWNVTTKVFAHSWYQWSTRHRLSRKRCYYQTTFLPSGSLYIVRKFCTHLFHSLPVVRITSNLVDQITNNFMSLVRVFFPSGFSVQHFVALEPHEELAHRRRVEAHDRVDGAHRWVVFVGLEKALPQLLWRILPVALSENFQYTAFVPVFWRFAISQHMRSGRAFVPRPISNLRSCRRRPIMIFLWTVTAMNLVPCSPETSSSHSWQLLYDSPDGRTLVYCQREGGVYRQRWVIHCS